MCDQIKCSFCGFTKDDVEYMMGTSQFDHDGICICSACIKKAMMTIQQHEVVQETEDQESEDVEPTESIDITPEYIRQKLDERVVKQDTAKEVLSVAIYNHYKRINNPVVDGVSIQKSNVMMLGPSGCGKTLLASTAAEILGVPFVVIDSTSIVETGFVGDTVDTIFQKLIKAANGDIELAQKGIVFLDEIDKKICKSSSNGAKDITGEGVQQGLLRAVEGSKMKISIPENTRFGRVDTLVDFDSTDVLFICGGAFVGIEKIIEERLNVKPSIGFTSSKTVKPDLSETLVNIEPEDVVKYGMIREFVGRFPIIIPLHDLNATDLVMIMTEPKDNIVSQFKALFKIDGVELEFDKAYLETVAAQALKRKSGARGLRGILDKNLTSVQYKLPSYRKEQITKIVIDEQGLPRYHK